MADVPIIDDESTIDFAEVLNFTVSNSFLHVVTPHRVFPYSVTIDRVTVKFWGDGTVTGDLDEFLQKAENLEESNYGLTNAFNIFMLVAAIRTSKMLETLSQAKEHN